MDLIDSEEGFDEKVETLKYLRAVSGDLSKTIEDLSQIVNIQNNYEGANTGNGTLNNNANYVDCAFNPIDKIVQLYDKKIVLYERMLKEKDEMMLRLEKLIQNK